MVKFEDRVITTHKNPLDPMEVIKNLQQENEKLKAQLKIEQDCVDFYADLDNWYQDDHHMDYVCIADEDETDCYGGKLARETQSTRK